MKSKILVFLVLALMGKPLALFAQPPEADIYPPPPAGGPEGQPAFSEEKEEPPPPPGEGTFERPYSGRRWAFAGLKLKQFRDELLKLGQEIRENKQLVQSLEAELETVTPGLEREEVRKKLLEAQHRQAELELTLARRRVQITKQARDLAQKRYDNARLELEKVKRKIMRKYPDLVDPLR